MENKNLILGAGTATSLGTALYLGGRKLLKNPNMRNAYQAFRGKPVMQKWMLPAAGGVALTGGLIGRGTAPRRD